MSPRSFGLSDALQRYVNAKSSPPNPVQRELIEATAALGDISRMQVAPEQGTLLGMLVSLIGARSVVEVGTFTGYSSLAMALALPSDARILCCDVSEEWTAVARDHWRRAGVEDRIDLRIAPAIETLRALPADFEIDFVFIDADKVGYVDYYEELLPRLSPGGAMAVDNTLWSGRVIDDTDVSEDTEAVRRFNSHVAADPRTEQVLTPVGDGLTLIRHR